MPKGKIIEAHAVGTKINISFKPSEGNIAGTINITCPDGIVKTITPRHLNPLLAGIVAKKLIGTEWDIPLFGQMSKEQRKKDLKRRGLWVERENKMEITWEEKKTDEKVTRMKYTEKKRMVLNLEGVSKIDEFDDSGHRVTLFKKEEADRTAIEEAFEKLPFVDAIKNAKRVEVR
jgi:hypothetical protein